MRSVNAADRIEDILQRGRPTFADVEAVAQHDALVGAVMQRWKDGSLGEDVSQEQFLIAVVLIQFGQRLGMQQALTELMQRSPINVPPSGT